MKKKILFNKPNFENEELTNIKKTKLFNQFSGSGNSHFTKKCSDWLKSNIGCKEALIVNSCTSALEMCAILLDIKKGDEIILPSYTFVSTANAFVLRGAKPIFVDIEQNSFNIDPNKIEAAVSKKTKAIVVVHYAGISCDMSSIKRIAKKNKLVLIEDAAQAILAKFKKNYLGSIGDFSTFSFHDTKNIHCGEGGAILINNKKYIERAKIIRDKGTNRDLFNKKIVSKYSWVDIGSSYVLSEINAAILYTQFKKSKSITRSKVELWNTYHNLFINLENEKKIKRPIVPNYAKINGHLYWIEVKKKYRDKLINYLKKKNIIAPFHYVPLHNSPYYKKKFKNKIKLHFTENKSKSLIRMPLFNELKKKEIYFIVSNIEKFFKDKN